MLKKTYDTMQMNNNTNNKVFTLVAGVNGVGKSTYISKFLSSESSIIIDPDVFIKNSGNSISGGRKALSEIEKCINSGINFTEETTLSGKHILKTIKQCKAQGYTVNMIYIGLSSPEKCLERIADRVRKGGHNIPEILVKRRYEAMNQNIADVLPLCDCTEFYDNENEYVLIAEYSERKIKLITDNYPVWMQNTISTQTGNL